MPRVSEQYRAERRAGILVAAARLFAVNGFHATSMADIISASGRSAGAVYRYFRSKEELVGAVAEQVLSAADELFAHLLADGAAPAPAEAVAAIIEVINERIAGPAFAGVDVTRIAVQVWSEALRSPELAARVDVVYQQLRGHFAEIARRRQAARLLPADAVPQHVGAAMLSLVQGFALQRLLVAGTEPDTYLSGVRALLDSGGHR